MLKSIVIDLKEKPISKNELANITIPHEEYYKNMQSIIDKLLKMPAKTLAKNN